MSDFDRVRRAVGQACPDVTWMSSQAFIYSGGTTALYDRYVAGNYVSDSGTVNMQAHVPLPPNWVGKKVRVCAFWRPSNGSAGNTMWDLYLYRIYDGGTFTAPIGSVTTVIKASPGNVDAAAVTVFEVSSALPMDIGDNELLTIKLQRRGANASDTYAYAVCLLGVSVSVRV